MKRAFLSLALLLLSFKLLASWSASSIYYASEESLRNMVKARGLEIGTADEMRKRLYEYEGIEEYVVTEDSKDTSYTLSILSAESMERVDGAIIISGNAVISFVSKDSDEKKLQAGKIIVDVDNRQITALENVSLFDNNPNASINEINADIISVLWESGDLTVTDATTSSERKNSEDESITFYTTGSKLTYFPEGGILYEDGYMSSDPVNRYSSIKADQIAVLPGGDMFISNAFLSIGRVPILYLPFFFFPGSRILGNPSFGFSSSKGAFINTTFELLGSSPSASASDKSSSFTAIFRSTGDEGDLVPTGFYYGEGELNNIQKWAKKSESYIALLADAYTGIQTTSRLSAGILHFGLESQINLLDKKLKLSLADGFGFTNPAYKNISDSIFRYYGINTLSYSNYGLKVDGVYPYYSDDYVLMDFKNRLSGFSLDPLLGQNPEFPTDYSSIISSFTQSLNLSYTLPSKYTNKYVSSFSISSLRASGLYKWVGDSSGSSNKDFRIEEVEKPYLSASISGSIFETKGQKKVTVETKTEEETPESEIHIIKDPLLYDLYEEKDTTTTTSSSTTGYSSSLKYSISETLTNKDNYSYGKLSTSSFSSSTSSKFTLSSAVGSWLSFSDILTPAYSYLETKTYTDSATTVKATDRKTMNNEVSVGIPFLGFKYVLATKLINDETKSEWQEGVSGSYSETKNDFTLNWDKNTVTEHLISFSKEIKTSIGSFTPYISYTLKPLIGALQPKLSYKYGQFASAFSWKFKENDSGEYKSDLIELSIGYNGTHITFSSAMKYASDKYISDDFFYPFSMTGSTSIRTKDKKWSITEYIDYETYSTRYLKRDYFNAIRTTFISPFATLALNWKTQTSGEIDFNDISFKMNLETEAHQFWKGRIYLKLGLDSTFTMDMNNKQSATFTITPTATFSIAEFLDLKLSLSSYNNNFYKYFDDDKFKFNLMFEDLLRSFDFFGDGRTNTDFLLKNASLEIVHYMKDWDLHCKYSTEIVQSSNIYSLVPKFSIFLSWKTLPDLKVDRKWKQEKSAYNTYKWVEE